MIWKHEHRPLESPELLQPVNSNTISQPQNKANNEPEHLFNYRAHSPLLGIWILISCFTHGKKQTPDTNVAISVKIFLKSKLFLRKGTRYQSHLSLGKTTAKRDVSMVNEPQSHHNKINRHSADRLFCRIKVCFFRRDALYRLAGLHTEPIDVLHFEATLNSFVLRICVFRVLCSPAVRISYDSLRCG